MQLGALEVPAGTRIDISSYVVHRLPWLHSDPERFDPARFETPISADRDQPFLMGPHACIGMRLAMIELPSGAVEASALTADRAAGRKTAGNAFGNRAIEVIVTERA